MGCLRWLSITIGLGLGPVSVLPGVPKYIAGTSFFDPAVVGQPVRWTGGQVNYYVDQGPLNGSIGNQ